jgi:hypothetical protein
MKKALATVMCLVLGSLFAFAGCAENAAATAKCKDSADSNACSECCTKNGASGNTFTGAGSCTCRGGG